MRIAAILAGVVGASCSYGLSFKDCELTCGATGACPDGFACNAANQCRIAGAVGSCPAMPDAGPPDDGNRDAGSSAGVPGIYVTDIQANQVLVFAIDAEGSAAPIRTIAGSNTMMFTPYGIAIDHAGEIVVVNLGEAGTVGIVTVYSGDADGDAAPIRVLTIPGGFTNPFSVAIGSDDSVFVAAPINMVPTVFHFPAGAVTSDRSFTGNTTQGDPFLAVRPSGEVVVAYQQEVDTFAATASQTDTPLRSFTRPVAGNAPAVVAIGDALAITEDTGEIQLFDGVATGSASAVSTIAPAEIVHGAAAPAIAVDASGGSPVFYLIDDQANDIFVVPTTGSGTALTAGAVRIIVAPASLEPGSVAVVP